MPHSSLRPKTGTPRGASRTRRSGPARPRCHARPAAFAQDLYANRGAPSGRDFGRGQDGHPVAAHEAAHGRARAGADEEVRGGLVHVGFGCLEG